MSIWRRGKRFERFVSCWIAGFLTSSLNHSDNSPYYLVGQIGLGPTTATKHRFYRPGWYQLHCTDLYEYGDARGNWNLVSRETAGCNSHYTMAPFFLIAVNLKSLPRLLWPILFIYRFSTSLSTIVGAVALDSWPSKRITGGEDGIRTRVSGVWSPQGTAPLPRYICLQPDIRHKFAAALTNKS